MFSNSIKQYAQKLSVCFQYFEDVFLNVTQFLHNNCSNILAWYFFRFLLRMKVTQLPRKCSEVILHRRTKLQGKLTKQL